MAARKKTVKQQQGGNGNGVADARALAVVIEEQRAQFKVFGEALQGVRDNLTDLRGEMDRRFDGVDREIALVKGEIVVVKGDLSAVKGELSVVKGELSVVKTDLSLVKSAVLETNRDVKDLRRSVGELDARKVDRDELALPPGG
jgi:chromosome segregation ATPase